MRNQHIPVQDHPGLGRDRETGAIVDLDHDHYESYMLQKEARRNQSQQISQMEHRINNIESDLSDIKILLTRLLEK